MPYAIRWESPRTGKLMIGPVLTKFVEVKGSDTRKKVPKTKKEAQAVCDRANLDPTWGNVYHTLVERKREIFKRENPVEKFSSGNFWNENLEKRRPL